MDAVWSLQGNHAELSCGQLSGRIDVTRPQIGLRPTAWPGQFEPTLLLGPHRVDAPGPELNWPLPLTEAYIRGNDLVAAYGPTSEWPFAPQLYWRANSLESVDGVLTSTSLLVSVQTHLLDTYPRVCVASRVLYVESLLVSIRGNAPPRVDSVDGSRGITNSDGPYAIIRRLNDLPFSYVETMATRDYHVGMIHADKGGTTLEWFLFAEFLEKGVIRRASVHAALVPRDNDIEIAAACCEAIERLELPLTT